MAAACASFDMYATHVVSCGDIDVIILGQTRDGTRCALVVTNVPIDVYVIPRDTSVAMVTVAPGHKLTTGIIDEPWATRTPEYDQLVHEVRQHAVTSAITIAAHSPFYGEYPTESDVIPNGPIQCARLSLDPRTGFVRFGPAESGFTFVRIVGSRVPPATRLAVNRKFHGPEWIRVRDPVLVKAQDPRKVTAVALEYHTDASHENISTLRELAFGESDIATPLVIPPTPPFVVLEIVLQQAQGSNEIAIAAYRRRPAYTIGALDTQREPVTILVSRATCGAQQEQLSREFKNIGFVDTERTLLLVLARLVAGTNHPDFVVCDNVDRTCGMLVDRAGFHKNSDLLRLFVHLPRSRSHSAVTITDAHRAIKSRHCPGVVLVDLARICHKLTHKAILNTELDDLARTFGCESQDDIAAARISNVALYGRCSGDTAVETIRGAVATVRLVWEIMEKVNVFKLVSSISDATSSGFQECAGWVVSQQVDVMLSHCHQGTSIIPDPPLYTNHVKTKHKKGYKGGLNLKPRVGLFGGDHQFIAILDVVGMYSTIAAVCFGDTVCGKLIAELREVRAIAMTERNRIAAEDPANPDVEYFDLKQQSFKLASNSITGAVGRREFRYYYPKFPADVTRVGREALTKCSNLVGDMLLLYGDTDSIMVIINADTLEEARTVARDLAVRCAAATGIEGLTMSVCAMCTRILILSKKKYAYIDADTKVMVQKGMDSVRHDWCPLGRTMATKVTSMILADNTIDEISLHVSNACKEIVDRVGGADIRMFGITKSLSKDPSEYRDTKPPAHVVAARTADRKYASGDYIEYVMCTSAIPDDESDVGEPSPSSLYPTRGHCIATDKVDVPWYIHKQIVPMVTRVLVAALGDSVTRAIISKALVAIGLKRASKTHIHAPTKTDVPSRRNDVPLDDADESPVVAKIDLQKLWDGVVAAVDDPNPDVNPIVSTVLEHAAITPGEFCMVCPACTAFETWMVVVKRCVPQGSLTCHRCNAAIGVQDVIAQFTEHVKTTVSGILDGSQWAPDVLVHMRTHYDRTWRAKISGVVIPIEQRCSSTDVGWIPKCVAGFEEVIQLHLLPSLQPGSHVITDSVDT